MRIALVAGEASGDALGAGLMRALRARFPDATFEGVAGPQMSAVGAVSYFPMERLAVMGLVEVLKRLPELLRLRAGLARRWRARPPDVFIGIDAPDFNLPLARRLKASGIPTVQYVSPSVWAWRQGRLAGIARSVDLMLCLLPFEADIYRRRGIGVATVGHPLADKLRPADDPQAARPALGLVADRPVVAVLPGSRGQELAQLGQPFADTIAWLQRRDARLQFVAPMANAAIRQVFERQLAAAGVLSRVRVLDGRAAEAMAACDVVLLASGTATLEAMLLGAPMVVAYRFSPLTYRLLMLTRLRRMRYFSLPNLLADAALAPEFIQTAVRPEAMGEAVLARLPSAVRGELAARFARIGASLRGNASERAAAAVAELLEVQRRC